MNRSTFPLSAAGAVHVVHIRRVQHDILLKSTKQVYVLGVSTYRKKKFKYFEIHSHAVLELLE